MTAWVRFLTPSAIDVAQMERHGDLADIEIEAIKDQVMVIAY